MKTYILRDPNSVEPQKAQFVKCVQPAELGDLHRFNDLSSATPGQGREPRSGTANATRR
jgi:hypothetical protein